MLVQSEQSQWLHAAHSSKLKQQAEAGVPVCCSELHWASFLSDITPLISPGFTTSLQYASGSTASETQAGSIHAGSGFGAVG